ncbi:MAG: ATP-dependent protease ATPase subunit HslU [Candidatus Cloacimonadaceae bacterium]|nr:ATP-dependent protease ATPase subunit HslU [Candidatus Cloacimonadaceae bacterium]
MSLSPEKLTPARIVFELDKYIIGQHKAKRCVAIALRNRWRRQQVLGEMQQEIIPNNIILIGPTGVGKTEIARRLSRLANAPFIKVEASKFTEVGYVGRDVESMVRELMNNAVNQVRHQMLEECAEHARALAIAQVLDILVPGSSADHRNKPNQQAYERKQRTRAKMQDMLLAGKLDQREIEFKTETNPAALEIITPVSMEMFDFDINDMMSNLFPSGKKDKRQRMNVPDAINFFTDREANRMINKEKVVELARYAVENNGIIFIDELDKIAVTDRSGGIDVSRSGVQRDLLPIVEGSSVPTKYGSVDTAHILFIAAGAFHSAKPSDLIPELQGRFPIRVELHSLSQADFERILKEPENALTKQYTALFASENVQLTFAPAAIKEIAHFAALANEKMEDIGARRLHTIMNALLEEYLFSLPDDQVTKISITGKFVQNKLSPVIESEDLSRFIL